MRRNIPWSPLRGVILGALIAAGVFLLLNSRPLGPVPPAPRGGTPEEYAEVMVWRVALPKSREEELWAKSAGKLLVLILGHTKTVNAPGADHPGMPSQLIAHQAVAVPPQQVGPPFRFTALLPRELPATTVLSRVHESVLESYVDRDLRRVPVGTAGAHAFRRVTMVVVRPGPPLIPPEGS